MSIFKEEKVAKKFDKHGVEIKQSDLFPKFAAASPKKKLTMYKELKTKIAKLQAPEKTYDHTKANTLRDMVQLASLMRQNMRGSRYFSFTTTGPSIRRFRYTKAPKTERDHVLVSIMGKDKCGKSVHITPSKFSVALVNKDLELELERTKHGTVKSKITAIYNKMFKVVKVA